MIYTVTLNPSIDFIVRIDKVEIGEVNRMEGAGAAKKQTPSHKGGTAGIILRASVLSRLWE